MDSEEKIDGQEIEDDALEDDIDESTENDEIIQENPSNEEEAPTENIIDTPEQDGVTDDELPGPNDELPPPPGM